MTIRIEITGENAGQVAQQMLAFTATMSQLLAPRAPVTEAVHQGPAPDAVEAETVEQPVAPQRRGRKKAETVEHEPKKESEDVPGNTGGVGDSDNLDAGESGNDVPGSVGVRGAGDSGEHAEPTTETAKEPAETVNIDDLRKYVVGSYLNTFFDDLDERKAEFHRILGEFGVTKLAEVPAERLGEVKAYVDAAIAKLAGAK